MKFIYIALVFVNCCAVVANAHEQNIKINANLGRVFDGIGAISGGGATSKLLINYKEPERSYILDYLFKPSFGASLQILKVEIGGDSQSTDGAEASHMHSENDENYNRGYEWWLMKEAKKRNPHIKLYGLPWVFPGWLGGGIFNPYYNRTKLVHYVTNWVRGAKLHHGLDIDYLGVWNERPYDIHYIALLKNELRKNFPNVKVIASDAMSWQIVKDYINSTMLQKSLDIIGYHYPGSYSPQYAQDLPVPLWASEEYSARNDIPGGGCWARVLNEGYVNGLFTAYIAWNLITSYYDDLPYTRSSLMTANQPWSGYYQVNSPIWMSAHHTQFTSPGWFYLKHGFGSGNLSGNGSYISYVSPDHQHLTMVIETLDPYSSPCFYPMPKYTVAETQKLHVQLSESFRNIEVLYVRYSHLTFDGNDRLFQQLNPLQVTNGSFSLVLKKNEVYTLTTVGQGNKGEYPAPPQPKDFPLPYKDDFEAYTDHSEAYNLAQQAGVWEVRRADRGKVITQVVPEPPIDTCRPQRMPCPVAVIGNYQWADVAVQIDVYTEDLAQWSSGIFLGVRVNNGGCRVMYANGVYLWLYFNNNTALVTGNFTQSVMYKSVSVDLRYKSWHTVSLSVQDNTVTCSINGTNIVTFNLTSQTSANGFVAIGTTEFKQASFDNLLITRAADRAGTSNKIK